MHQKDDGNNLHASDVWHAASGVCFPYSCHSWWKSACFVLEERTPPGLSFLLYILIISTGFLPASLSLQSDDDLSYQPLQWVDKHYRPHFTHGESEAEGRCAGCRHGAERLWAPVWVHGDGFVASQGYALLSFSQLKDSISF